MEELLDDNNPIIAIKKDEKHLQKYSPINIILRKTTTYNDDDNDETIKMNINANIE